MPELEAGELLVLVRTERTTRFEVELRGTEGARGLVGRRLDCNWH